MLHIIDLSWLEDSSEERIKRFIEKFEDFKKQCYTNEQDQVCKDIIYIAKDILDKKKRGSQIIQSKI